MSFKKMPLDEETRLILTECQKVGINISAEEIKNLLKLADE